MKYLPYYLYALIILVVDQATKWVIVHRLMLGESRSVIGEFFQITSHRNKGAAFGILQNQRWFFIVITIFVVIGIIWYLKKTLDEGKKLLPFALSLLLGGAIGNFIDRARTGEVVDFFQFTFDFSWLQTPYIFPIFNIADSAIVTGVALIFLDAFLSWRREAKQNVKGGSESGDLQS